ncbi:MAG: helix-turn-helix transcriptional regulator [Candidatus Omnitrophota bacterium]
MDIEKVDEHLKEKLKNPYFKELHELEEQKLGIVKRIISYRIKNNLSQKELARKIKITQQHISKIENGDFSSIITLEKVLLAVGYTVRISAVPLNQKIRDNIEHIIAQNKLQFAS